MCRVEVRRPNFVMQKYYTSVPLVSDDARGVGPFLLAAYEWELRNPMV
jgi:hypothetical protein